MAKGTPTCAHPNDPLHARRMCRPCYIEWRKGQRAVAKADTQANTEAIVATADATTDDTTETPDAASLPQGEPAFGKPKPAPKPSASKKSTKGTTKKAAAPEVAPVEATDTPDRKVVSLASHTRQGQSRRGRRPQPAENADEIVAANELVARVDAMSADDPVYAAAVASDEYQAAVTVAAKASLGGRFTEGEQVSEGAA